MNRFRARRKAKEEAAAAKQAAEAEPITPFKLFSKGKKSHEEPEKKIDLASVLPPTDDFRTSLLMTGLSARFSMLREQDDPNSKIGKASDDSVILSNRQSRGPDLNFGNLGDIAEVESVRAPQSLRRMNSFTSSSDADAAGVMGRGRPTEGNVLFGGRQKVYKVSSATASGGPGGMGKVMYEDDVTISSFQKWRQAEKEKERQRQSLADQDAENIPSGPSPRASELEALRPESPPTYNRKRETASTTSSAPSASRNSTAATSVTSQKDWHHPGSSATSPTPIMEKTVARTRRLYEQGLTQELQNNQSHALSRIDTLTRRGPARTPDMSQSSSPTANHFGERAADRKLLAKASAPNMQTTGPLTAPRSATSPTDLPGRTSGSSETRPFGTAPLSPSISEHEESPTLPIHANDRGKATAMGVFQKPNKPYDESRFAQRQMQLQQGRETPTQPSRDASPEPPKIPSIDTTAPPTESPAPTKSMTFLEDDDEDTLPQMHQSRPVPTCQPGQVRPADEDHPAFRSSALPTPLTFVSQSSDDAQTHLTTPDTAGSQSVGHPKDSPTLGPPAGLSGMVRQHLRSDSGASSIYGMEPQPAAAAPKHDVDAFDSKALDELVSELNPWAAQDQEWRASFYTGNAKQEGTESPAAAPREHPPISQPVSSRQSTASSDVGKERDPFHSQLADGARRVRERLTTYVESDGGSDRDVASTPDAPLRPKLLRNQSSRVSLADRARDGTPSRAIKKLGLSNATMTSTPSPNKQSFDEKEQPLPPMEEEPSPAPRESPKSSGEEKAEGGGIHAGLRQFRNARRELQRLKEAEAGQRQRSSSGAAQAEPASGGSPGGYGAQTRHVRSPSRERRPPPVSYSRPASTEPWAGPGSNPGSRAGSRAGSRPQSRNDRDRSGSETSNGGRSQSRPPPPRMRKGPPPEEYQQGPQHGPYAQHRHTQGPPRQGMLRSPGLPGTDVRRSPIVPPQPFPGNPEGPAPQKGGLSPYQQGWGPSGQSSPVSPMGDLPSPYGAPSRATLGGAPPRPVGAPPPVPDQAPTVRLDDSMKRAVRKKDISEPTFVSSTSRVPTVNLPDEGPRSRSGSRSRSRSGSLLRSGAATASTPNLHSVHHAQADAPPVPPINPRRRVLLGRGESDDGVYGVEGSAFSISDEEEGERRRLRKGEGRERAGAGMARPSVYGGAPIIRDNGMPGGLI